MNGVRRRSLAVALAGVLLAGCGVPLQETAQPLPPDTVPGPLESPSASPTPTGSPSPSPTRTPSPAEGFEVFDAYFVREDGLVPTVAEVPIGAGPQQVLQTLVSGPPPETGLRTVLTDPLTGNALVTDYVPEPGQVLPIADATIAVSPAFSALPSAEQVLLLGQVVLSLNSAGWRTVLVVDESGSPLAIPLPDGRLLDRPATALDFVALRL